jgi:hypothetical protein
MFPNVIALKENKWCETAEDRETIKAMTTATRDAKCKQDILDIFLTSSQGSIEPFHRRHLPFVSRLSLRMENVFVIDVLRRLVLLLR